MGQTALRKKSKEKPNDRRNWAALCQVLANVDDKNAHDKKAKAQERGGVLCTHVSMWGLL